jgi:bile acid-coenzyme A ligase
MAPRSYGAQLRHLAETFGDGVALTFLPTEGEPRDVSWRELDRRSNQVARLLQSRGVRQGTFVAIGLRNSPEHYFTTYAVWKLGATPTPIRWDLPEWELERLLAVIEPSAVVGDLVTNASTVAAAEIEASDSLPDDGLPDAVAEPARAIATSGSTGSPKLVVFVDPGYAEEGIDARPDLTDLSSRPTQIVLSPLYHTNGFRGYFGLLAGQRLIVMERFDAARAVDAIERYHANFMVAVPTMLQRIARLPGIDDRDLSSLENVLYGAAPLPEWAARKWFQMIPPERFIIQYGGTEQFGRTACTGVDRLRRPGTVGRPVGCDIKILAPDGTELPQGEVGEIWLRRHDGLRLTRYRGAPQAPRTEDDFTTFGDMGHFDADGYLYVDDRRSDMIISGGANVFPAEVEAALSSHPDVADVVVVGVQDPEWGRRVHAIVQLTPAASVDGADLRTYARQRLAPYKVPKGIQIVDALPRTPAGKINRLAVAAAYAEVPDAPAAD